MAYAPPLSQFQGPGQTAGNISRDQTSGVYLGGVNPNELTSQQMAALMRSDNPIVQRSAQNALNASLARGGGLGSTMVLNSATQGAIDSMAPIAQADANRYGQVADENLANLNQENITGMNNRTSENVANIGAGASIQGATINANMQRQLEQMRENWNQQQAVQNRGWQVADQNTAARAQQRSQVFNTALQTIFSDPSYWRDPQGAVGLINTYSSNLDQLLQNLFPEYYSEDQNGNPTGQAPLTNPAIQPPNGRGRGQGP